LDTALGGVDYFFQAAALKQLFSCDFFPMEATKINMFGTENVIKACVSNKIKNVICLSTRNAVCAINSMCMTKVLIQKLAAAESSNIRENKIKVCPTRHGNVMASSNKQPMPDFFTESEFYFDAYFVHSIKLALKEILLNPSRRADFIKENPYELKNYSWSKTSKETFSFVSSCYLNYLDTNEKVLIP
jgi:nucleoside-diphosphate-sugar epimerase